MKNSHVSEVKAGFRTAGSWILGFLWLFIAFAGLSIAFTPNPYPPFVGWILLAIATGLLFATTEAWVKVFPGLLAYGVIGGITMLVSGHAVNHPDIAVSRPEAFFVITILLLSTLLSLTFTRRKLRAMDRVALVFFVVCSFWQVLARSIEHLLLISGLIALAIAWAYDHARRSAY